MKRTLTPGRPKRWIVVDDNAALGEVIYLCLGQLGLASVEWYASGADAIEALAWDRSEIELLVTDCDMPGLNGLELARRLRADLPSLKVILVTANHADLTAASMADADPLAILPKPFSIHRLEKIVRGAVCEPISDGALQHSFGAAFAA